MKHKNFIYSSNPFAKELLQLAIFKNKATLCQDYKLINNKPVKVGKPYYIPFK